MRYSVNIVLSWIQAVKRRLRNRCDQKYNQKCEQKPKTFFLKNSIESKNHNCFLSRNDKDNEFMKSMVVFTVGKYQLDTSQQHQTKT